MEGGLLYSVNFSTVYIWRSWCTDGLKTSADDESFCQEALPIVQNVEALSVVFSQMFNQIEKM